MDENKLNIFDLIFEGLDGANEDFEDSGIELLGGILAFDDEKFNMVKNTLLESFAVSFNSPDVKLSLSQMMNVQGIRIEDIVESLADIDEVIESQFADLSDSKKDFLKTLISLFVNSLADSQDIAKRVIQIPIELCRDDAKLPTYATIGSAAMDVYSTGDYSIAPGECVLIPLGIKVNIPKGYALLIQPRSGMSVKTKLRVANTPGLIDSDYHDEICVIMENISGHIIDSELDNNGKVEAPLYGSEYTISKGDRCAQMRLVEVPMISWLEVNSLGEFDNDHGAGFGSTGIK